MSKEYRDTLVGHIRSTEGESVRGIRSVGVTQQEIEGRTQTKHKQLRLPDNSSKALGMAAVLFLNELIDLITLCIIKTIALIRHIWDYQQKS